MLLSLFNQVLSNFLYLFLNVGSTGAFPRPLSSAEEKECLIKMEQGDDKARQKLIEHNLRLVAHIIKKYYSAGYEQDDLISIGTIGLIKAVSSYNRSKGTRLATFASKCIENEILMYFRGQKKTSQDISMCEPIDCDKDGNALTLSDIIADDLDIIDNIDIKIKSEKLRGYMAQVLDEREREILMWRYGLDGYDELTQREVAKKFDISRSYVSRIEKKALERLNLKFNSK